jgi:hypothetical protein
MPDDLEHRLTLRQADQARTDFAALAAHLEFLMAPDGPAADVQGAREDSPLIAFVSAVLGIVGIEAFWRYFPACSSTWLTRRLRTVRRRDEPGETLGDIGRREYLPDIAVTYNVNR